MTQLATSSADPQARERFLRRSAAMLAMLAVGMIYRAETLTDWDSWDYAAQAIQGHSSDLLLGRWWFIATMRGAYLLGHHVLRLPMLEGYLAMQMACAFIMAAALAVLMAWTYRLTKSAAAEVIVAGLILPGPLIGIYATAVMTEGLTVLMIGLAFLLWQRAIEAEPSAARIWALVGGACFGVAADIREPAALLCAWPIISCLVDRPKHRWQLLALAVGGCILSLGLGIAAAQAWYPWPRGLLENIKIWSASMAGEREKFPVPPMQNLSLLAQYAMGTAPVLALLVVPALVWAALRCRRMFYLGLSALPYTASLVANHDLVVNPRFVLPLMWILAPMAAAGIAATVVRFSGRYRLRLAAALLTVVISGGMMVWSKAGMIQHYYFGFIDSQRRVYDSMLDMPEDSAVVAGPGTPVAMYLNRLRMKDFEIVASGWMWPDGDLKRVLGRYLDEGRNVYVNCDSNDWLRTYRKSGEWDTLLEAIRDYQVEDAGPPMVRLIKLQADGGTFTAKTLSHEEQEQRH